MVHHVDHKFPHFVIVEPRGFGPGYLARARQLLRRRDPQPLKTEICLHGDSRVPCYGSIEAPWLSPDFLRTVLFLVSASVLAFIWTECNGAHIVYPTRAIQFGSYISGIAA
jgi:hypothetical protein